VAELAQTAARKQRLTLEGQLDWVMRARSGDLESSSEDQQLRIEADSDAVLLTTVHRSKGLEFPFVICPFLWDSGARRKFNYLAYRRRASGSVQSTQVLHLEPKLLEEDAPEYGHASAEQLRENARLLYVALTRAKHQVAVVWVKALGSEKSALAQLLFGPVDSCVGEGVGQGPRISRDALARRCRNAALSAVDCGRTAAVAEALPALKPSRLVEPIGLTRVVAASVQTTSYSALTSVSTVHSEVGRDVDALSGVTQPGEGDTYAGGVDPMRPSVELPLAELPAGPRTGEALHTILELADFQHFEPEGGTPDVAGILERFGLDGPRYEAQVRRGLGAVLEVPLNPMQPVLKLANVAQAQKRSELEFLLKVRALSVARLTSELGPELTGLDAAYQGELGRLHFDPITGYLRGFIDLVFEQGGRFYVVDYKSNALGDNAQCFELGRLKREMRRHHYPVQAAIYAAAVDRWLRGAKAGYDYETHFGGVYYLFLRGMRPELGATSGVFFHRPSAEALQRFERMLEGGGGRID
jgi:exodeoxyribonuclease V beta subunit